MGIFLDFLQGIGYLSIYVYSVISVSLSFSSLSLSLFIYIYIYLYMNMILESGPKTGFPASLDGIVKRA